MKFEVLYMVKLVKRLLILLLGLSIAHLGVTLFKLTNLGEDPFNVFVLGVLNTATKLPFLGFLTHGTTHMVICLVIIIAILFVDKSYIKIGTIVCMICGGPIIDFFTWLLGNIINENTPYVLRLVILAAGCVILAFGMTIVIKSEAGTGPNDLVSIVISDKLHKNFGVIRILVDVSFVVFGFIMGRKAGIGTIVCAFLVGPVANIFLPFHEKWIKKII